MRVSVTEVWRLCSCGIMYLAITMAALAVMCGAAPPAAAGEAGTAPNVTASMLVKLVRGLTAEEQAAVFSRCGGIETSSIPPLRLHVVEVSGSELAETVSRYTADPQVERVELNQTRQAEAEPTDPLYPQQWGLPRIGWDSVFGSVYPFGSATVAVLDTGVDATHPELAGKVLPGISFLDGSTGGSDPLGHGTWLAGIVAATADNGTGTAGIAFGGISLLPVTVLDADGNGRDSDVISGVIWAADHGADIILMGFSNAAYSDNLQDAIDYAWSKGAVLVAATGNGGLETASYPAGNRGVIGVSATDRNDALAPVSNFGTEVFLAAPGTDIYTTDLNGGYTTITGTSASSAVVAGVAGYLKALDPALTNGVIVGRLARSADAVGTPGDADNVVMFGNGRVNMAKAAADTGTDPVQPTGVSGGGGPIVGAYAAAAASFTLSPAYGRPGSTVTITSGGGAFSGRSDIGIYWDGTVNTTNGTLVTTCSTNNGGNINGACSFTVPSGAIPGSTHTVAATQASDKQKSIAAVFTVKRTVTTAVSCSPNPVAIGVPTTCTLSVTDTSTGSAVTPTGTATWSGPGSGGAVGSFSSTTCTLGGSGPTASCSVAYTATGGSNHTISASYSGDSMHDSAASIGTTLDVITQAPTTLTVDAKTGVYGGSVDLSATLKSGTAGVAGKTVLFTLNGVTACGISGKPACPVTDASGLATLANASLAGIVAGSYPASIQGAFAGDTGYAAAGSSAGVTVGKRAASVTPAAATKTYGDADTTLTGTLAGFLAADNVTASYTRTAGENAGTYAIAAALAPAGVLGNYDVTYNTAIFTVTPREIAVTADARTKTYGEADPGLTYTFAPALVAGDSFTGALTRVSGNNVGSYGIEQGTLALNGNYTVAFTGASLVVTKRAASVTLNAAAKIYGDADPVLTGTLAGFLAADDVTAAYTRAPGENAGTYAVTATLAPENTLSNYDVTYITALLTIAKATPTVTVIPVAATFDGTPHPATGTVTGVGGTALGAAAISYDTADGNAPVNAGSYTATGSFAGNENYHAAEATAAISIARAAATITVAGYTGTYDGLPHRTTGTATGVLGEDLGALLSLGDSFTAVPGGTVRWTFAGGTNYREAAGEAAIVIEKAPLAVKANDSTRTYGETNPAFDGTITGIRNAEAIAATYTTTATTGSAVGTYAIIPAASGTTLGNYDVTYLPGTLTVGKATLTVAADGKSKTYGTPDPQFTFTATGFVNGETAAILTGTLARAAGEDVAGSPYAISQGSLGAGPNYRIVFTGANLAVVQAPQAIAFPAPASPATYGTTFTVSPASDSGLTVAVAATGGCTVAGYTVTMTSGTTACVLTATQPGNGNYHPAEAVSRTVAAQKAVQTIAWTAPADIVFGSPLVDAHLNATALGGAPLTYAPARGSVLPAGMNTLTVTAAETENYLGATKTVTVRVIYGFNGLLAPYAADKAYKVKSAIPIKWQYTNVAGATVNSASSVPPTVTIYRAFDVENNDYTDAITLNDAGTSGYQYDPLTSTWQYNWKTTGLKGGVYYIRITSPNGAQTNGAFAIKIVD